MVALDLDRASAVDGPGIAACTLVTAYFEPGDLRAAVSAKVGAAEASIPGTTFPCSARGVLTSPAPAPANGVLFGTRLSAVVQRMRRAASLLSA